MKTRRDFLRMGLGAASAFGAASMLGKLGEINALASCAPNQSYQALVCIFLNGGNDSNNMVIPLNTGTQNYNTYATSRQSLALPQNTLLGITNAATGESYALHPNMPELAALYAAPPNGPGKVAIVSNVGMLVIPLLNAQAYWALPAGSPNVPVNLFSHSDQTNQWQMGSPTGLSPTGWGGRLADFLQASNCAAQYPPVVNNGGCGPFCTGQTVLPATVPTSGPAGLSGPGNDQARITGYNAVLNFSNGMQLVQAANDISTRGINEGVLLSNLLNTETPLATKFPATGLGAQLQKVAQIIAVRSQLGIYRQVFFCSLGGFDTHGTEVSIQGPLLQQLSQAMAAFYNATAELNVASQVTTFTASEFSRTVMPNSSGGTDHAWGAHHLVMGGAVQGGSIYGKFPSLTLGNGNPLDVTGRGSLLPTTSVDQYAATLAAWFGVPLPSVAGQNMTSVLPNIVNFQTPTLGFLG